MHPHDDPPAAINPSGTTDTGTQAASIPARPQPVMMVLTGISFAGKSVLARAIHDVLGLAVIDPDAVGHEMGLGRDGEFLSDDQWDRIHREAEQRARHLLRAGKSLVYDTTAFTVEQRQHLRALAHDAGASGVIIFVDTPRDEAYRRWEHNTHTRERFSVHEDDFAMVADRFERPDPDEHALRYTPADESKRWIEARLAPLVDPRSS
jgi:predicted kinase